VKELVETVCKALVDMPEDVKVTQIDGEQTSNGKGHPNHSGSCRHETKKTVQFRDH
jgi:hypothetical protein